MHTHSLETYKLHPSLASTSTTLFLSLSLSLSLPLIATSATYYLHPHLVFSFSLSLSLSLSHKQTPLGHLNSDAAKKAAAMSRSKWKCKIVGSSCLCEFSDSSGRDSYRNDDDNDDDDSEVVEVDPTGRYCRYKEVLGKGACKTVYRAFDEIDGMEVAWNQVNFHDALLTSEDLERVYSEVHLLKTLKHKHIIKYYHSWVDSESKSLNFITEFFTSGTLRQYRNRHRHVNMKAVKNWSRQILCGLLYLHSHDPPIIHRDLKCDNIFVNGNQGEVKIGDLGLATILQKAHLARGVIGTPEFMAPELYEEEYTELVDIYSFGMCLLEMVTFQYPYTECTNVAQIFKKVTSGKKPEALNKVTDLELRYFIEKCLATASERMSVRDLLMDPFLLCDDGNGEAINYSSPISPRVVSTEYDDMDDEGLGDAFKSNTVKISYGLTESFSSLSSNTSCESSLMPISSHHAFGKLSRNVGIEVKGKRGEDDTVFLRLRISDCEGHIGNIHFPFDMEGDTAMSVATEMVAELDLSDQDVTKIADMIDAAVLFLVPEWQPGVAIDNETGLLSDRIPSPDLFFDADKFEEEEEDILAEEERLLISKQEQELKDLHWKHEAALIELRRKWHERRYSIPVESM